LGKQLLGQRDKHDVVTEDKSSQALSEAFNILNDMVKNRQS